MLPLELRQHFCKPIILAAGDTTKELMPAVVGLTYVITSFLVVCLISAAQSVYLGDSSGTVKALSLAASYPANSLVSMQLTEGVALTPGESIVIKPAAAGPSFSVIVEGYTIHS